MKRLSILLLLVAAAAWAQASVVGTYKGEMSSRLQTLVLSSNRNAQLTTNFPNKPQIVQKGTWKASGRLVTCNFATRNGKASPETIVFQLDGDEMVATQYNPRNWGANGLVLSRWQETPPGASGPNKPVIDSLLVSPARALKVGEALTVVLTGTPGCRASFDILGVAQDVILQEVSSGRYQATLNLTQNMVVNEAVLVGRLSRHGHETLKEASRSVTVEPGTPASPEPTALSLLPTRDSRADSARPLIGVNFPAPVSVDAYRLYLDGAEVTGYAQMSENFLRYTPRKDLSRGRHVVRLLGPGTDEQWTFFVGSGAAAVTPSPASGTDTTSLRPQIKATFAQPVQTNSIRLWLDQRDVTGSTRLSSYDVSYQPGVDLAPGPHEARVTARNAAGERVDYSWSFNVGGSGSGQNPPADPMWVNVTSPPNNSRVPMNFIVTGRATPSMIIQVEGSVTQPVIPGVIGVKSQSVKYSVYASPDGSWSIPVTFPGTNGSVMDLTLTSRDSYGTVSAPTKLRYVLQK